MRARGLVVAALLLAAPGSAWAGPNTWTPAGTPGQFTGQMVRDIVVAPSNPNRIIVITGTSVYRSEDGGATFAPSVNGLADIDSMNHVAFDPTNANRVWITGPPALGQASRAWLSTDGGANWVVEATDMNSEVSSIAVGPDGTAYAGLFTIWRRASAASSWTDTSLTATIRDIAVHDAAVPYVLRQVSSNWYITRPLGGGWLNNPAVDSSIGAVYGLTFGSDGTLWKATQTGVKKGIAADVFAFADGGLASLTQDIAQEVGYQGKLWAASTDVYRSTDNGATWRNTGLGASAQHVASTGLGNTLAGNINGLYSYTDTPPQATTGGATDVGTNSATLNGTANVVSLPGSYRFVYGTALPYGVTTTAVAVAAGPDGVPVSAQVAGLAANTTYHYALLVTTSAGETVGSDGTFTTAADSPGPGPGPGPGADLLALGASKLSGTWAISKLKGTLKVSGTLGAAASVRVRLYDKANRVALSKRIALPAGAFTRTLALPAALLPGRYRLELLTGTERDTANLTLAAPKQGVTDRAFISALRGGPPATRLSARRHQLWARFRFASLPTRGAVTVRWFGPGGAVGRAVGKPRERTVDGFVNAGSNLPAGAWRCELRVGGVLVAVARVRLG